MCKALSKALNCNGKAIKAIFLYRITRHDSVIIKVGVWVGSSTANKNQYSALTRTIITHALQA